MILIDLQKAFRSMDHDEILKKQVYTIDFAKHLLVNLGRILYQHASVFCSVSQISILGLLLLLIYANDMIQAVKFYVFLYGDGSYLICQSKDIKKINIDIWYLIIWNWSLEN